MWASYRKIVPVEDLSETEMAMIRDAKVETSEPFNLSDIPEMDEAPSPSGMG